MTTTVTVLIEGNKECEVKVVESGGTTKEYSLKNIKPNTFTKFSIHGDAKIEVKEIGEFIQ